MPAALLAGDHNGLLIRRMHLLQLDQQRAAVFAGWGMGRAGGITKVCASQVVAQLVCERALENEDLLAAAMVMQFETATG